MIVHVWTIVRNEAWMLPHFLRHYGPLADRIFVVDDQSDDGTRAIAEAHPRVTLLDYPYPTGLHEGDLARAYEALTREHSRGQADWVLCPDADEFLVHADLRRLLAEHQRVGTRALQAEGVLCGADEMPETTGPLWEALPYRQPHAAYSKTIILAADQPVRFGPGRHTTSLPGVRDVPRPGITLYHCCYLSPAWVEARLAKNFARIPERPGLAEEEAYRRQRALAQRWWRPRRAHAMRIDVYSTMHNEALLVPYWLRHYETVADRIFVWEDQSTDDTRLLLKAHPKVTLRPVETHGIDDVAWVRGQWDTYRTLSRGWADWVIVVDADEFVYHPFLLTRLAQCARDGARILKCDGYHMIADHVPTTRGQIYEEITTGVRDFFWCHKPCIFSPGVDLQFAPGRHHLKEASAPVTETDIKLLHYRFLGEDYCRARSARNLARMSARNIKRKYHKPNRPDSEGPYSLHWYQQQRALAREVVAP